MLLPLSLLTFLATAAPAGSAPAGEAPPPLLQFLIQNGGLLLLFGVIFWFLIIAPQRRQKKEFAALMRSIGRGTTVRMKGGEIGKVVKIDEADDTILLKVDESNNVKIRYARASVDAVIEAKPDAKALTEPKAKPGKGESPDAATLAADDPK